MLCDLHTHSVFSDGTYTPAEIIAEAEKQGLSSVALSDHNTVDGLSNFLNAAENSKVNAIAGAEFSVDYGGTELHLLGLFIRPEYFSQVSALMKEVNALKEQSNIELVASLKKNGYDIDYEEIKQKNPCSKINRAHIAAELTEKGYVSSKNEAFGGLLSPEGGHYKEPQRLTVFEMIKFLRSIKAAPVLAHPLLNLSKERLKKFLPPARLAGLIGMECIYSTYSDADAEFSLNLIKEQGLLPSGGSDFHGKNKPDILLGKGSGNLQIPNDWAEAIRKAAPAEDPSPRR